MFTWLEKHPSGRILVGMIVVGGILTFLIRAQFAPLEAQMQAAGGYGIVDYELAFSAEKAGAMLSGWGESGQAAARQSLLIDFAFMPAYAILFGAITLLLARTQAGRIRSAGLWLTVGQIGAALLDGLENAMLLILLGVSPVPAIPPLVAGVAASIKFGLLLAAILYWLACGVIRLWGSFVTQNRG